MVTEIKTDYSVLTFRDVHLVTWLRAKKMSVPLGCYQFDSIYTCRKQSKKMASWVKGRQKIEARYVGKVLLTRFEKGIRYYSLFGVIEEWDGPWTGELVKQYEIVQQSRRPRWPYGARLIDAKRAEFILRNLGVGLAVRGELKRITAKRGNNEPEK